MAAEKRADYIFPFLRLERTNGIDERAAIPQPGRSAVEQFGLQLGALGDDLGASAVEHLGMAAEGAGRRARGVEQDRVELALGRPRERVSRDQLGVEVRPLQIFAQSSKTTLRCVDGHNTMAGSGELHRLAG